MEKTIKMLAMELAINAGLQSIIDEDGNKDVNPYALVYGAQAIENYFTGAAQDSDDDNRKDN